MKTFQLSKKKGNEHWTRPVIDRESNTISFVVQDNDDGVPNGGTVNRTGAFCLACNAAAPLSYVRELAQAGDMGEQMTAIVAEGDRRRLYISSTEDHAKIAGEASPAWRPTGSLPNQALGFRVQRYGVKKWHQLFTERQLTALTSLRELLGEIHSRVTDCSRDTDYGDAVCSYLALAVGRSTDMHSSFVPWRNVGDFVSHVFSRQAISMVWDFAEGNFFSTSTGNWTAQVEWVARVVDDCRPTRTRGPYIKRMRLPPFTFRTDPSSLRTRPTTTTSAMPISPTSSTCGYARCCARFTPTFSRAS